MDVECAQEEESAPGGGLGHGDSSTPHLWRGGGVVVMGVVGVGVGGSGGVREGLGEGLEEGRCPLQSDVRAAIGYLWLRDLNVMLCMSLSCHEKAHYSPRGAPAGTPSEESPLSVVCVVWPEKLKRISVVWPEKLKRIMAKPVQP